MNKDNKLTLTNPRAHTHAHRLARPLNCFTQVDCHWSYL